MSEKSNRAARREALIAECRRQRVELSAEIKGMRYATTPAGIGASLLETVRHHKLLSIAGALALTFIKPRRLIAGLEMVLVGWGMWERIAPLLKNAREHFSKR